ncbi:winged helix-turn-helix domain-containing protein [Candidatus Nitrosotenuis chungbukensis]|uniref:ArsR/SmtB family transcription factor n=1 Tax=Candidatus Nitrosotenuis chungbukensis TaxID=1353246 RepID=UPI000694EF73|nr:winged helix-turn-helix domain-containing protein [Candidatus Nitrosotenuis chungbukensis]WKT57948.1 winged helix-turn-helix domain-containing protein [Candidatus Nitrosotenuis chungbukensis]
MELVDIRNLARTRSAAISHTPDRDARRLLLYVFTGTRGGHTRLKIISLLSDRPLNTNQIASEMNLDYKAIQHHLEVLEKNNLVAKLGGKYGALFYLSNYLEVNILALDEVATKLERKLNAKKVYL